ncbi:GGDEF domain-containing protein [Arabiibacter massiliensis]|uniref:GGDEF domain-containing protein n=1 Tax=Arabiibacter massiliensis TaxID=1870985 RepID=UPI0009BC06EB|nr:GGDEF domain-containing protein [Arabiibacter massiliensis]
MNGFAYAQADFVPALALAVVLANSRGRLPFSRTNRLFQLMVALTIGELVLDIACSFAAGGGPGAPLALAWTLNVAFYSLGGVLSFLWFTFVRAAVRNDGTLAAKDAVDIASLAIFASYEALIVSSPWTHALFSVDAQGGYQRGPLFAFIFAVSIGYAVASAACALRGRRASFDPVVRRRCAYFAAAFVPTVGAGAAQTLFSGLSLLVPGLAVSVLLVYLDLQRGLMVCDGLTGLYNRGRLDRFLAERCARGGSWCLAMFDVDGFKEVNDSFGHAEGDRALRHVADVLKHAFGREDAFIARFGGDEFAVVLDDARDEAVERLVRAFDEELAASTEGRLEASVGWAFFDAARRATPGELIAAADAAMYARKRARGA